MSDSVSASIHDASTTRRLAFDRHGELSRLLRRLERDLPGTAVHHDVDVHRSDVQPRALRPERVGATGASARLESAPARDDCSRRRRSTWLDLQLEPSPTSPPQSPQSLPVSSLSRRFPPFSVEQPIDIRRVELGGGERRRPTRSRQNPMVVLMPRRSYSVQCANHPRDGSRAVRRPRDDLRDQRVVGRRHRPALDTRRCRRECPAPTARAGA